MTVKLSTTLNTTWNDPSLRDVIENKTFTGVHISAHNIAFNTYEEARSGLIRALENAGLWEGFLNGVANPTDQGGAFLNRIHDDGKHLPTIGYGFNLARPDIDPDEFDDIFTAVYGSLTPTRQTAAEVLEAWKGDRVAIINNQNPNNTQMPRVAFTLVDDQGTPDPSDDKPFSVYLSNQDIIDGAQLDNQIPQGGMLSPLQTALAGNHAGLTARQVELLADKLSSLSSLTLTNAEAEQLLTIDVDLGIQGVFVSQEQKLNARLNLGSATLGPSIERVSLFSALYNSETLIGTGLAKAIAADNRALAWWELRYNHLAGQGQDRRDAETDIFRLISKNGADNQDIQEYKEAISFLFNGKSLGTPSHNVYDFVASEPTIKVSGLLDDIEHDLDFLKSKYAVLPGATTSSQIDFVQLDQPGKDSVINAQDAKDDAGKLLNATRNLIFGEDGNDTIDGKDGDDFLYGGADNDTLIGGKGADFLHGGDEPAGLSIGVSDGVDVVDYSKEAGGKEISVTIKFTPDDPNTPNVSEEATSISVVDTYGDTDTLVSIEEIIGTSLIDIFEVDGLIPDDFVLTLDAAGGQGANPKDTINASNRGSQLNVQIFSDGTGFIRNDNSALPTAGVGEIRLKNFNTRIIGSDFDDRLVDLGSSAHEIDGGDGHDEIIIAGVAGSVTGGLGDDTIGAYAEGGTLPQGNTLDGGDGDDLLIGSEGAEILMGGAGDDIIHGGFGNDTVDGGAGNDRFEFAAPIDVLEGILNIQPSGGGSSAQDNVVATVLAAGPNGEAIIDAFSNGKSGVVMLSNIETVNLTDNPDVVLVDDVSAKVKIDLGVSTGAGRDLVDYSGLSQGINFYNGHVSYRDAGVNKGGVLQLSGFAGELATIADAALQDSTGLSFFNENLIISGADHIILTDHDDAFIGATRTPGENGLLLEVGAGADKVWFTDGLGVVDLSYEDRVALFGAISLFGGGRNELQESPYAKGLGGLIEYGVNVDNELVIRAPWLQIADANGGSHTAEMFVLNWQDSKINDFTGAGGITIFDYAVYARGLLDPNRPSGASQAGTWQLYGLLLKSTFGPEQEIGGVDPLVLDLDGDGFELTNLVSASPKYDIDNDFYAERTAFVKGDDGVLARDINGDGVINDASELFGYGQTSGFSILSALDGNLDGKVDASDDGLADFNGDGVIDAADTFSSLLVWRDLDRDVFSDAGELFTLASLGIESFDLNVQTVDQAADGGNRITGLSTFTYTDGSTGGVADVHFRVDNFDAQYVGAPITVIPEAAAMPDLRASGTLVTLHEALSVVPSNVAVAQAALANLSSPDPDMLAQAARPILYAWVEGSPLKLQDGTIVTGPQALTLNHDVTLARQGGAIVDYNWGLSEQDVTLNGVTMTETTWSFASGRVLQLLRAPGSPLPDVASLWEFDRDLGFSERLVDVGGTVMVETTYQTDNGFTYVTTRDTAALRADEQTITSSFVDASGRQLVEASHNYTPDQITAADLAVFSRIYGESLDAVYTPPLTQADGILAISELFTQINDNFRILGVRLAAQAGPLSQYFQTIDYSAETDKFTGVGGQQLQGVFTALIAEAENQADPLAWYSQWKDFLDIVIGDFNRGDPHLANTHGFLVQNIVTAIETVQPSFSLIDASVVAGVPIGVIKLGSGVVDGTNDADIFYLDSSDQTLKGGGGLDTYVVGGVIGNDVIDDREKLLQERGGDDVLRFSAHNSSDITASRVGIDLILTIAATGETITIKNQFDGQFPSFTGGDFSDDTGVREIIFADGEVWSDFEIAHAVSRVDPNDNTIIGTRETDELEGGQGDDFLQGGGDADIYIFNPGDGHDTIQEGEDNNFRPGFDVLRFTGGIRESDLIISRDRGSTDVTIGFVNSSDTITINDQFEATETGVFGTWWLDRIEFFTFDDGSALTYEDIMDRAIASNSTSGDDFLYGFSRSDILDAGAGNDFLSGGDYDDTYVFGRGYGQDVIKDGLNNILTGRFDRVVFNADVSPEDIVFVPSTTKTNDLTIQIAGTNDILTIQGQFDLTPTGPFGTIAFDQIEEFVFTDGSNTVWTPDYLRRQVLNAASTSGNDHIYGFTTSDIIDGGAGDDTLEGGGSSDIYIFGRGSGHDVVRDDNPNILLSNTDQIDFGSITFGEVTVARDVLDLVFTINDTGDSIRISGQYDRGIIGGQFTAVEQFKFADGVISFRDLNPEDIILTGTLGDDTLVGTNFSETFDAKEGNDLLIGNSDGDIYIWGTGYGSDTIDDYQTVAVWNNQDIVRFTDEITQSNIALSVSGEDLIITINGQPDVLTIKHFFGDSSRGVERFEFADNSYLTEADVRQQVGLAGSGEGPDILYADAQNPVLDGREGDDELHGGSESTTYVFGVGYDRDKIFETSDSPQQVDVIQLKQEISPDAVTLVREGSDIILKMFDSGDELRIVNGLGGASIEEIRFYDGTVWDLEQVKDMLLQSTPGDDQLLGYDGRNDVLAGGEGSDALAGGTGDDVYRYNLGDGADTVFDSGGYDVLEFGDYIALEDLKFAVDGLTIVITVNGHGDNLAIISGLDPAANRIEELRFADGRSLSFDELRGVLLDRQTTDGADLITGFDDRDDILTGGAGPDALSGLGGDDLYQFSRGDGVDLIDDQGASSADRLVISGYAASEASVRRLDAASSDAVIEFANGDQIILKGGLDEANTSAIETIAFDDVNWTIADLRSAIITTQAGSSNETIYGFVTSDTLAGGAGDDVLIGGGGADAYEFTRGDGFDVIADGDGGTGDILNLHGIAPSEVQVGLLGASNKDVVLDFGLGDGILLRGNFSGSADQVSSIYFDDGTIWSSATIKAFIEGGYRLNGGNGSDILISTPLNDTLLGGYGDDTYVYNLGDGNDIIFDGDLAGYSDVLQLGPGIIPGEVTIKRLQSDIDDILLTFTDGGTVLLDEELADLRGATIDQISFQDGTIWTRQYLLDFVLNAAITTGDDYIVGTAGANSLAGGAGDDTLVGGDGVDTYIFNVGDGHDLIVERGYYNGRNDDVLVINGYSFTDVTHYTYDNSNYTLHFGNSGDSVTVQDTHDGGRILDRLQFDDGVKTIYEIFTAARSFLFDNNLAPLSTSLDDRIIGTDLSERVAGGLGFDTLSGGRNDDQYDFHQGDGVDHIDDFGYGSYDTLRIYDYDPSDVIVQRGAAGSGEFFFTFNGTTDRIDIPNGFEGNFHQQIELVVFDNGVQWTPTDVVALAAAQPYYWTDVNGDSADNIISLAGGNIIAHGGLGSDDYVFSAGDGVDTIQDAGNGSGNDRLVLHGYNPTDLNLFNEGEDLYVRFNGSDDSILIKGALWGSAANQIEQFIFDDSTIWDIAQIRSALFPSLNDGRFLIIDGTPVDDTLIGGAGNDTLSGRGGGDTYEFSPGDGDDIVNDNGGGGAPDKVVFHSYAPSDIRLANSNLDLIVSFNGSTDTIRFVQLLSGNAAQQIEEFHFDNNVVWDDAQLRAALFAAQTDSLDRVIDGTGYMDTIAGGAGNDTIHGAHGGDTYVFNRGDGVDLISDGGRYGTDQIEIHGYLPNELILKSDGGNLSIRFVGASDGIDINGAFAGYATEIEQITFDNGVVWDLEQIRLESVIRSQTSGNDHIEATRFSDTLTGGFGNDTLIGHDGSDVYLYNKGDGRDIIHEQGYDDNDQLVVTGYDLSDAAFRRLSPGSDDLLIDFGGSDSIVIVNGLINNRNDRIESVSFNGTVVQYSEFSGLVTAGAASSGNDIITGSAFDETLIGGLGDDLLSGGDGADDYVYSLGEGSDRIVDLTSAGDRLFVHGVDPATITVRRSPPNGFDLVLTLGGETISIADGLKGGDFGVEQIIFDDATIWTPSALQARIVSEAQSSGADRIWGFDSADTIGGGAGDDTLMGGDGGDLYFYSVGDGQDTIADDGGSGIDRIEITGYASTDVGLARLYRGANDIVLTFVGSDDSVTILNTLDGSATDTIEEIYFSADNVTWDPAQLLLMLQNNAPVAMTDSLFPARQGQTTIITAASLLSNDFDADNDQIAVVAVKNAEHGSVSLDANGDVAYSIDASYEGVTSFEYTISDGNGALTDGVVYVRVEPAVTTRDDAGIIADEDTALLIDASRLLANDVDGDRLSIAQVGNAVNGTVLLTTEHNVIFTPDTNFNGDASFTYTANLPNGGVSTSTVSLIVQPGNDAPVAHADGGFTIFEEGKIFIDAASLLANDTDIDGDSLAISSVGNGVGGTAVINNFGDIVFTGAPDFFGTATFDYVADDGAGGTSTGVVTISVTPVNDAPVVIDDVGFSTNEDMPVSINSAMLLANDSDPDGDPFVITRVFGANGGGANLLPNGVIDFTPAANFYGTASFIYEVDDGQGGLSLGRVEIDVAPVNDAPIVADETGASALTGYQDTILTIDPATLLANDYDVEGDALSISSVSSAANGSVSIDANTGEIIFQPTSAFTGIGSFDYAVSDGAGGVSFGHAEVNVLQTSHAPPVAVDDSGFVVDEDGSLTIQFSALVANDYDIDNDPISLVSVSSPSTGQVIIDSNGDIVFTPSPDFFGQATFNYRIGDGVDGEDVGQVQVAVNPVNDAPVVNADTASTSLDTPTVIRISDLLANDTDVDDANANLNFTGVTNPTTGALSIVNNRFIVVDAPAGYSGQITFNYTISDPQGAEAVGQVTTTIASTQATTLTGTPIDDLIIGSSGAETLEGLAGPDTLYGRGGDDTLIGGVGGDSLDGGAGYDTVDYSMSNAAIRVDLSARIGIGGDAQSDALASIEAVIGTNYDDQLYGDLGDNHLFGGSGADTLLGGAGADTLEGGSNGDEYQYSAGFGDDVIRDNGEAVAVDKVIFDSSIAESDISLATDPSNSSNLIILHGPSGSRITVENYFNGGGTGIEEISFSATGTTWDRTAIDSMAAFVRDPAQTLYGTTGDDTLTGGTGNDTLFGKDGSDTYTLVAHHGNDFIKDLGAASDIDRIYFDASISPSDLVLTRTSGNYGGLFLFNKITGETVEIDRHFATAGTEGVEEIHFGDGTIWDRAYLAANAVTVGTSAAELLYGTTDDERIDGGLGDDTLNGKDGNDDYLLTANDGNDKIDEFGQAGDVDRIVFDASVSPLDIEIRKTSATLRDLLLVNNATGETIEIDQQFLGTTHGVEQVVFSDGTVWDQTYLSANAILLGTFASEDLLGDSNAERIQGLGGDDTLRGATGSDDYLFSAYDGNDLLDEYGTSTDVDRIIFDYSVAPTDLLLTRGVSPANNTDTVFITNVVTGSVIEIDQQLSSTTLGIEEIHFADGTIWDRTAIANLSANSAPVVLDLDGDGIELLSFEGDGVRFDFDGDGRLERGGWVAPDDGVLALDRNGDGRIAGANEISFLSDSAEARSDLQGLGAFDSNGDGKLSAEDDAFSSFLVWRDANSDGVSQRSELSSLAELGITSLSPIGTGLANDGPVSFDDNSILRLGSIEWEDGDVTDLADVALRYHDSVGGEEASHHTLREFLVQALESEDFWRSPIDSNDHSWRSFTEREAIDFTTLPAADAPNWSDDDGADASAAALSPDGVIESDAHVSVEPPIFGQLLGEDINASHLPQFAELIVPVA